MKPIKKVIIKYEKYEDGYSELLAKISKKGDLVIDGCDAGELAEEGNIGDVQWNILGDSTCKPLKTCKRFTIPLLMAGCYMHMKHWNRL